MKQESENPQKESFFEADALDLAQGQEKAADIDINEDDPEKSSGENTNIKEGLENQENVSDASFSHPVQKPTVFEKNTIGELTLINVLGGANIKKEYKSEMSDTLDKKIRINFVDPTNEIDSSGELKYDIVAEKEIPVVLEKLKRQRILLIDCADKTIAKEASLILAFDDEFDEYEKRILDFKGDNLERSDLSIDSLASQGIGAGKKIIVIVSLTSIFFWDSIISRELNNTWIKQELESNDRYVICTIVDHEIKTDLIRVEKERHLGRLVYEVWEIPFLKPLLSKVFSNSESSYLIEQVEKQSKQGHWGKDDIEIYDRVFHFLQVSHGALKSEVFRIDEGSPLESNIEKIAESLLLIEGQQAVIKPIIFTASFFPGLSINEFRKLVNRLIGEKEILIEEEVIRRKKNKIKRKKEWKSVKGGSYWQMNTREIFKKCQLIILGKEDGNKGVEFENPDFQEVFFQLFEQYEYLYIQNCFDEIVYSGVFLSPNTSDTLSSQILKMCAKLANEDPDHYGITFLLRITLSIAGSGKKIDLSKDDTQLIAEILDIIERREMKSQASYRLGTLILEMASYPKLSELLKLFFNYLIEHHAYAIILEIIYRLRFSPHFDKIYWIKQLINRGNIETKGAAFHELIRISRQSNSIFELFDDVSTWVPGQEKVNENFSPSNIYALQFLYLYASLSIVSFPVKEWGRWPSKYNLFQNLERLNRYGWQKLIRWLFEPRLAKITYQTRRADPNISRIYVDHLLIGQPGIQSSEDVIENWYGILIGLEPKKGLDKNPGYLTVHNMLSELQLHTSENLVLQRDMIHHWKWKAELYSKALASIPNNEKPRKEYFKKRRALLLRLSLDFSALLKS